VVLANSVLADNAAAQEVDVAGVMTSFGYNFVEDYSNSTGYVDTDLGGGDPLLGALAFNGGPTPTHAIQPGSALINRGDPAAPGDPAETDQRGGGFPRRRGLYIDMGAFEFPQPDEDGDGMPDEWEMEFGLDATNQFDAAGDDDGDRQPNLSEYIADTVPTNGDSFLHISEVSWAPGAVAIGFPSSTARVYRLQANTDLVFGAWQDVGGAVTGASASTTLPDSAAAEAQAYRISVRLP